MAFGQSAGPPATARQLRELMELVAAAGHRDLRDARGPLGLSQRQAAGKFTRDEADALIQQLQAEPADPADAPSLPPAATVRPRAPKPATRAEQAVRALPSELLAAELQRRGWIVMDP